MVKQAGRRTGSLAAGSKTPLDRELDKMWEDIRARYQARLAQDIANGVDNSETRRALMTKEERAQRAKEEREEAARKAEAADARRRSKSVPKPKGVVKNKLTGYSGKGARPPQYDWEEFRRLYVDEKLSILAIKEKTSANESSIRAALKKMKVYEPGRDKLKSGGTLRAETCKKGHDMKEARIRKDGTRACKECAREYAREYYKRKKKEK